MIPIYEICIIGDADFSIRKVKYAVDNQQLFSPFLCLNINDDCDLGSILLFLDWLKSEILNKQLNLYSVNALRCDIVNQRLLENKFQHSCPEITKLQW